MKIRVISEFYDKYHTSTLFKVGAVLDFDEERANDVIAKKLAEPYSESEKKKPGRPAKEETKAESAPAAPAAEKKEKPAKESPKAKVEAETSKAESEAENKAE